MKPERAMALAIAALEREIKALAVEANLHDLAGARYPVAIRASERRKELRDAVVTLQLPQQARMKL